MTNSSDLAREHSKPFAPCGTESVRGSDRAYQRLRKLIITAHLEPGALLVEKDLMASLRIGRTPLREAVLRLSVDGLVEMVPRRGAFVAPSGVQQEQQLLEARRHVEGVAARLATKRITTEEIADFERLLLDPDPVSEFEPLTELDRRYHLGIAYYSRNVFLQETIARLHSLSVRYLYLTGAVQESVEEIEEDARVLLDAFRRRAPDAAAEAVWRHLEHFAKRMVEAMLPDNNHRARNARTS